ncbi:beta-propeller domain-containing protein [Methylomicrobium sp. RS1]|uniref:beta-propeller domain-containing protein n=1 Tax=Candidatus Methylomicrobium oryzae TaxID=2802053 RepID=UPI001920F747|nr:beta-propeller domain-containing protein [Methylomicrobium sp. RS1]MBL1264017.1 beta-propeller domain-containing protein [Methylomicrobium sp. RS1]
MRSLKFFCFLPVLLMALAGEAYAAKSLKPQRVKSYAALKRMLSQRQTGSSLVYSAIAQQITAGSQDAASLASEAVSSGSNVAHFETNVQVAGVDEGDGVKTDGDYIYQIADGRVRLVKAHSAQALAQVAELVFDDGFYPAELYVEGARLAVLGNAWQGWEEPAPTVKSGTASTAQPLKSLLWMPPSGSNLATAKIYDISDKANPRLEREVALEGDLLSSRKIGDSIYFVSRNYPRYYLYLPMLGRQGRRKALNSQDNLIPHVSDTAVKGGDQRVMPISKLYYFPDFVEPDYVVVAGFQLSQPALPADVKAYYGSGDLVYASHDNLYLSAADYTTTNANGAEISNPSTRIYKFALQDGKTSFLRQGEVPGTVLNQFSMDENGGFFRIATTHDSWSWDGTTSQNTSWSNIYVLDSAMQRVGELEQLAPDERIYAARFIGDRCYLVTFKQVDPLFVIDLAAPDAPKVLGELKIPGFSTYLHPYDADHIIGFGQSTDDSGGFTATDGLKLALFDVSDVGNPRLEHSLTIGDRGTYSPLLYDHKALWFDKERQLLGFPVEVAEIPADADSGAWGMPVFEGAYVYRLTPEEGFVQKAAITHQTQTDFGQWDYRSYIERLLTIDDQLYTVSQSRIQSQNLSDFKQTGFVQWEADAPEVPVDDLPVIDPLSAQ